MGVAVKIVIAILQAIPATFSLLSTWIESKRKPQCDEKKEP